jgi:hypothetical protein
MATSISELYDNFLGKISDYSFLSDTITQQDIEDDLFGYFKSARTRFYRCRNSLDIVTNDLGELEFTVDLHQMEIEVLATLMLVEYLKPQLITSETLKQMLGDKDFRISSQASQLREIRLLMNMMKSDAQKLITEYTYLDLDNTNTGNNQGGGGLI